MSYKNVEKVIDLFESRKQLFKDKNSNYGCSYIKAGQLMSFIMEGKELNLKTPEDHVAYQIIIRKLDKLIRFCNLRFTSEEDKVGEKCAETMADDGVYAFMLAEIEENGIDECREVQNLSGREESSSKG
jgi:hypothetical protein